MKIKSEKDAERENKAIAEGKFEEGKQVSMLLECH